MYWSSRPRSRGSIGDETSGVAAWEPSAIDPKERANGDFGAPTSEVPEPAPEPSAEDERQARIDQAYQEGYDKGLAEGRATEGDRLASAVQACEALMGQVRDEAPGWIENLEKNLVALATAIARAIIGRELKGSAEDVKSLVREAVSEFPITTSLRVRLNPADLTAISTPRGSDGTETGPDVRWVPDPGIAIGGCVVEGPDAIVDGRVEKALDRIYTELIYG